MFSGNDLHTEYIQLTGARAYTGDQKFAGVKRAVAEKSADYTATVTDEVLMFDATLAVRVCTLPAATGSGREFVIGKSDSSVNTVTIDGAGAETINGVATKVLNVQYEVYSIVDYASGKWVIVG